MRVYGGNGMGGTGGKDKEEKSLKFRDFDQILKFL